MAPEERSTEACSFQKKNLWKTKRRSKIQNGRMDFDLKGRFTGPESFNDQDELRLSPTRLISGKTVSPVGLSTSRQSLDESVTLSGFQPSSGRSPGSVSPLPVLQEKFSPSPVLFSSQNLPSSALSTNEQGSRSPLRTAQNHAKVFQKTPLPNRTDNVPLSAYAHNLCSTSTSSKNLVVVVKVETISSQCVIRVQCSIHRCSVNPRIEAEAEHFFPYKQAKMVLPKI